MNNYQQALIEEHSNLVVRVSKLNNEVYCYMPSGIGHDVHEDRIEFANKCIQLSAMKKYEECLHARLNNAGIVFEDGEYYEKVAKITPPTTEGKVGSDFDVDSKPCNCGKDK